MNLKSLFILIVIIASNLPTFAQPSNDDPCNAIPLTVTPTCTFSTFTNTAATATAIADPNCTFYQGGDVWFSVVVPANGHLQLDGAPGDFTDGGMAVYTGDCVNLVEIACDDDASNNGAMPYIVITNQIPGSTLFIRFWEYGGDEFGAFQICAAEYNPPPAPAVASVVHAQNLVDHPLRVSWMVGQLLSSHEVRPGDLARVKALIEAKEQELKKRRRA